MRRNACNPTSAVQRSACSSPARYSHQSSPTPPPPALAATSQAAPVGVGALETNSAVDPIGIPLKAPTLSWQLTSSSRGTVQSAYQVRVATSEGGLSSPDVWDSGKVDSAPRSRCRYAGPDLEGATAYAWQVRVWDGDGQASDWSAPASFETALASVDDWSDAEWIGADTSIPASWTDYTMTFTASKISGALGVYFRGRDGGNAYMWQLSQSARSLRPHVKTNGNYSVLSATPFPAGFDFAAAHEYSITVDGTTIVTKVDGAVLDTRTVTTNTAPGLVGFRTSGEETGTVSDVKVTSESGERARRHDLPLGRPHLHRGHGPGRQPRRGRQHRGLVRLRRGRAGAAHRVRRRQGGRVGAHLRRRARPLRAPAERRARRRPRARAGMDRLQHAHPVPDLRRHRPARRRRQRLRRRDRRRLVRGSRRDVRRLDLRQRHLADRAAPHHLHRRIRAGRRHRRQLAHHERAHDVGRPARRRGVRRPPRGRARRMVGARLRRRRVVGGRGASVCHRRSSSRRPRRRCASPRSWTRRRSRARPTACTSTTSGRTWSATPA